MTVKDLTPAARKAVEKKTIGGGWDGRSLVKLLGELERWDNMAEARKAFARKVFVGGIIAIVVGFLLGYVVAGIVEERLWGLPLILAPLAVIIIGIRMKKSARAMDLPNELRVSLRPVLRQLSQDLHPNEKIKVSMNLTGIDEKKCAGTKVLPPGRNKSLTQSAYDEDLCTIRLPLTDGSTAVLRMENRYLKLERRYTTTRGKSKSKTKWKKLSTVTAMLIPPAPMQWEPVRVEKLIDRANERISFPEKDGVAVARMDRYYKFKAAGDPPGNAVPGADILRMFVRLTAMRPQPAGGAQ
ncbi:MAG: hypothetical protein ACKV2U_31425 [Bryobacteraceae bacterium]